ncbi:MAG: M20/M25/M40 family metallo-hydrolase [Candidatus Bathyarchaeota archaeon]|nr:M20/M25/M40 family metallo-hydrolase [Candidatus Bathyarchaeota archaeon]
MRLSEIESFLSKVSGYYVEDLKTLLKQPSISARGEGIDGCACMLRDFMKDAGFRVEVWKIGDANPVVYGEMPSNSPKTLLMYGHYDVQPPEPLEEWVSPPFEAVDSDGKITARGAADSKSNVMAIVKAVECYSRLEFDLPVNLKVLFEGEEEIGSPNLPRYVEMYRDKLKADAAVCFDGGLDPKGRPELWLGLKGMLYVELRCRAARVDAHSSLAPLIENPAWRLIQALTSLRSPDGTILVDGWYDDIRVPSEEDIKLIEDVDYDTLLAGLKRHFGVDRFLSGVEGVEALKKLLFQPTCNIAGLFSGYTGLGAKTVLPREACVKLDFRLVYDQNPYRLLESLRRHLKARGFDDIEVKALNFLEPSKTHPSASIVKAVSSAASEVYRSKPQIYPNSPGSGPDYLFTKRLGLDSVWTGCSPPLSNAHAPNEYTTRESFLRGILFAASIIEHYGGLDR